MAIDQVAGLWRINGFQIAFMAVAGKLHTVGKARGKIIHELDGAFAVKAANEIENDSLVLASIAVHVHVLPAHSGAALGGATFFCLA